MVNYEYTEVNRLESPHSYMYTKYYGDDFLKSYIKNRNTYIEKIKDQSKNENLDEIDQYLLESCKIQVIEGNQSPIHSSINILDLNNHSDKVDTNDLILSLIANQCAKKNHLQNKFWIDFLVQRFEVSKRLYEIYYPLKKIKGEGSDSIIKIYWLFSLLITITFDSNKNIKYLSTLLKLNDLICSLDKSQKEEIPKKIMLFILSNEIKNIEILYGREIEE